MNPPAAGAGQQPRRRALETRSEGETRALAAMLATVAMPGDRLALIGPLGAGKTQFAKGFAVGLGVAEVVNSPSFTLMAEYRGRLPLFHQDLFRLTGLAEVYSGGLLDERQDEGVTLSEWADRLDEAEDPDRLEVRFTVTGDDIRQIELASALGGRYERYLDLAEGRSLGHDRDQSGAATGRDDRTAATGRVEAA